VSESSAERLLQRWRPYDSRRLTPRELRVEALAAGAFVAVAALLPLLVSSGRDLDPGVTAALIVSLALASKVRLHVGAGSAVPTQLVFVPMLFLLPPEVVPACVAVASVLAQAIDVLRRTEHPDRFVAEIADCWYTVAPVLVFIAAGTPGAAPGDWWLLALALTAQCATDLANATVREWLGRGIAPAVQLRVIGDVYLVDLCLTPVGLAIAMAATGRPYAVLLVLPLVALLAVLASDRRRRIRDAVHRLAELEEERERLDRAILRLGEAFGSKLDRAALADIVVRTTVEAIGARYGRAALAAGSVEHGSEPGPAVTAAEQAARTSGERRIVVRDGDVAMAQPLTGGAWAASTEVLSIARAGAGFSAEEEALFSYLAQQTAVALENVALHDQLRREATVDEVTGLSNHRRFQEALAHEVTRMHRSRRPTALALIDIDDFKQINDTHGHQHGDAVLQLVADTLTNVCRATDEAARYGGDELAVILAETDLAGATRVAENIRRAVESSEFHVTVSIGVSALEPGHGDADALIETADVGLYAAKRTGKNRVRTGGWAASRAEGSGTSRFARVKTPERT
jgi:diguanylate cyclase (GGDEF)-like protein